MIEIAKTLRLFIIAILIRNEFSYYGKLEVDGMDTLYVLIYHL